MAIEIDREAIWLDFPGSSREEIIRNICFKLQDLGKTDHPQELYNDILEREKLVSTFAGHDTAIPHVVTDHIKGPALCFVRAADPELTWHGDSENVTFVVFSAVPKNEAAENHTSRTKSDFRRTCNSDPNPRRDLPLEGR